MTSDGRDEPVDDRHEAAPSDASTSPTGGGQLRERLMDEGGFEPARAVGRRLFGDRVGLTLWLGLLVTLAVPLQLGIFITDTLTIADTLVAVADFHLDIQTHVFGPTLEAQPGLYQHDGRLYGRNYGQVFLALPILWLLQAATAIAPLHLVLAAGWSIGLVAFTNRLGALTERDWIRGVGSVLALVAFVTTLVAGRPIDSKYVAVAALQIGTLLAGAYAGVLTYRLLSIFHERTVGLAGGIATGLAIPIGFWATIPKRHVLVALLVLGTVYAFALSRQRESRRRYRALGMAYVAAGLITWIHAFEGFFVVGTLLAVDVATAGVRDRRHLTVIVVATLVGLLPTLLTNLAISGDPFTPPRLLASGAEGIDLSPTGEVVSGTEDSSTGTGAGSENAWDGGSGTSGDGGSGTSGDGGSGTNGDGGSGTGGDGARGDGNPVTVLLELIGGVFAAIPLLGPILEILSLALTLVVRGLRALLEPDRVWHVFVRSGSIPGLKYKVNQYEAIDLTVLESAPLLGALVAVPVLAVARGRQVLLPWRLSPRRQTDLLVASLAVVFTVVYLPELPLFSQITVRYLLPIYPLGLYAVLRVPAVHQAIECEPGAAGGAYVFTTLFAGVIVAAVLGTLSVGRGEAMQLHALINLGAALALGAQLVLVTMDSEHATNRSLAVLLGVTAGLTTAFLLLAGVEYFQYGPYPVAVGRWIANALAVF